MRGKSDRQIAGARANVHYPGVTLRTHNMTQPIERSITQNLGFLTRDERLWARFEFESHEILEANQVRQWNARQTLINQVIQVFLLGFGKGWKITRSRLLH
jgi:hypothetical protein